MRFERVMLGHKPRPEPLDQSQALEPYELTWNRIIYEEPLIKEELDHLGSLPTKRERWKARPKAELSKLVGWSAENPLLRSSAAYSMVIKRMWDFLL